MPVITLVNEGKTIDAPVGANLQKSFAEKRHLAVCRQR